MAWSSIATQVAGTVASVSGFANKVIANLVYLLSERPSQLIAYEGGANKTTTSTSFAAVDTTNMRITLTLVSGRARIDAWGVCQHSDTATGSGSFLGGSLIFDVIVDATTRAGGTNGLIKIKQSNNGSAMHAFHITAWFTGLSAGSHTFDLTWKTSGATATLMNNAYPVGMFGIEA